MRWERVEIGSRKLEILRGHFMQSGTMKNRNSMDLIEAESVKKRWQEYMKNYTKKGLNNLDNHSDVVTHLEPDILECEVKWALGSIALNKASGGDGIPVELFKNPKR